MGERAHCETVRSVRVTIVDENQVSGLAVHRRCKKNDVGGVYCKEAGGRL
jgi:hypothetical protein